ncbi:hypothetical protein, partial [Achromobacter marplatensis]
GNKRCPRASNHIYACTRSNEPGQVGSTFIEQPTPQGTINGAIMTKEVLDAIAAREAHCKPFGAAVTLSVGERDALVAMARDGAAILRAATELPFGYHIELYVEAGYAGAKMIDPDGEPVDLDQDERNLALEINAAIDAAMAKDASL